MPEAFSTVGLITLYTAARLRTAVSPAARSVTEKAYEVIQSAERSRTLFGEKLDSISELWSMVSESRNSSSVENEYVADRLSANNAERFLRALPAHVRPPELAVDPDGAISLDWIESRNRLLTLRIGKTNRLSYAWLDGSERGRAVAVFNDEIPDRLLSEIQKLEVDGLASLRAA